MKISQSIAVLVVAAAAAAAASSAQATAVAQPEVLSFKYVNEGPTTLVLPTVKNADGSICVSYVERAERVRGDGGEKIDTTVKTVCGEANADKTTPTNLVSMRSVENDGLVVQLPVVRIASATNAIAFYGDSVHAAASGDKKRCELSGVSISGNANIRCAQ